MNKIFTRIILLIAFTQVVFSALGAPNSVKQAGKDFWITLAGNSDILNGGNPISRGFVVITSKHHASITFNYNNIARTTHYTVQPGEVLQIRLTRAELDAFNYRQPGGSVSNKSLHIQSDSNIVVHFATSLLVSEDGMLIYPTDEQNFGDTYYLVGTPRMGMASAPIYGITMFSFLSTCDSTVVEITPSQLIDGNYLHPYRPIGVPFTVVLNKGEVCQFGPYTGGTHITGTKIHVKSAKCCNPLNVFMTYPTTNMGWPIGLNQGIYADELLEQLLPVNIWDTLFPIVRFHNNGYNKINIVSASNNNVISMDGVPFKILMSGEYYDTIIDKPVIVRSSNPAAVTEYMMGQFAGSMTYYQTPPENVPTDSLSDPDALWCLSFKDGVREAYFKSLGQSYDFNGQKTLYNRLFLLTIISRANNVNTVMLDGVSQASKFLPFTNDPGIMYAQIKIDTGIVHHLLSKDRVIAYHNAAAWCGSISYNLGDVAEDIWEDENLVFTDTIDICVYDTASLSVDLEGKYKWSTGDTSGNIQVSDTGIYDVLVQSEKNCKDIRKRFYIQVHDYNIQDDIRDTVIKCAGEAVTLNVDTSATNYLWGNGNTTNAIVTDTFGQYHVLLTWQALCNQTNYYFDILQRPHVAPDYQQPDTAICIGDTLVLYGKDANTVWSTGEKGTNILITTPGIYWHEWIDSCSDKLYRDTVIVSESNCQFRYCNITYPNAFTPNGDGKNDVFHAIHYGAMQQRRLIIYNRWGQQVFQTNDINKGWDGTFNGQPAPLGTYMYYAEVDCALNGVHTFKGDMTLIR